MARLLLSLCCLFVSPRRRPLRASVINARLQSGFTTNGPLAHFRATFPAPRVAYTRACAPSAPAVSFHGSTGAFVFICYRCKFHPLTPIYLMKARAYIAHAFVPHSTRRYSSAIRPVNGCRSSIKKALIALHRIDRSNCYYEVDLKSQYTSTNARTLKS